MSSLRSFKLLIARLGWKVAPQSRGTVTLASANVSVLPVIDPGWLTSPTDQSVAVELYKKIRRIFNTNAFRAVRNNDQEYYPGLPLWMLVIPDADYILIGYSQNSDAQILSAIQNSLLTVWHASCTCAMQPKANNGVLDPYLKV